MAALCDSLLRPTPQFLRLRLNSGQPHLSAQGLVCQAYSRGIFLVHIKVCLLHFQNHPFQAFPEIFSFITAPLLHLSFMNLPFHQLHGVGFQPSPSIEGEIFVSLSNFLLLYSNQMSLMSSLSSLRGQENWLCPVISSSVLNCLCLQIYALNSLDLVSKVIFLQLKSFSSLNFPVCNGLKVCFQTQKPRFHFHVT